MTRRIIAILALTVFLVLSGGNRAAAQLELPAELGKVLDRLTVLLPPEIEAKLSLTEAQKKQVAKLQGEYDEKNMKLVGELPQQIDKAAQALEKVRQNQDFNALIQLGLEMQEKVQAVQKTRTDYQAKVRAVLNDEQKKKYDELTRDAPVLGLGLRELVPGNLPLGDLLGGRGQGGPLLPAGAEEKLKLTAEQKTKLAALQKEFDDKSKAAQAKLRQGNDKVRESVEKAIQNQDPEAALKIVQMLGEPMREMRRLRGEYEAKAAELLTADQKKQFEELKKAQPRQGRRPGGILPRIRPGR